MSVEPWARVSLTVGGVALVDASALALGAAPAAVLGLTGVACLVSAIVMWRRWDEAESEKRAAERAARRLDVPHRPHQTAEAQFSARNHTPQPVPDESEDDGPSYGP